jgi:hypothetical protein
MPRESTLDWVGRLGTSESDRAVVALINAGPGRSRLEPLTHPCQGRHRPRPWLAETWGWICSPVAGWQGEALPFEEKSKA